MAKKKKRQQVKSDLEERKAQRLKEEREKRHKRLAIMVTILLVVFVLFVLVLWKVSEASDTPSKTKAFQVGEDVVYMDEVNFCIFQNVVNLGIDTEVLSEEMKDGSSADDYYRQEIMDVITDYKVEAAIATKEGLTLTEEDKQTVKNDVASLMEKIDGKILRELGITQDAITDIYEQRYLAGKLEQTVTKDLEMEEVTYCTIYMLLFPKVKMDENGDYVKEADSDTPVMLSEEEIAKRKEDAEAAYRELQEGADIVELAKKYGIEDYSGEQQNTPESFGEPFDEYAKTLKEGEYSPVLDTSSCYAILKMVTPNNEELAEQIANYYRSDIEKETIEKNRTKWYEEAGVSKEMIKIYRAWDKVTFYDFVKYVEE